MFDHGIMIDYDSTDASADIVREMAPEWEIRKSRNREFDARLCDDEVMSIEEEIEGWKITLNTTEFLLCSDLNSILKRADEMDSILCIDMPGHILVDTLEEKGSKCIDYSRPLIRQRHHGICAFNNLDFGARERMMHKDKNGRYHMGRHMNDFSHEAKTSFICEIAIAWVYWTFYSMTLERKMTIQNRFSKRDLLLRGTNHVLKDAKELEENYMKYLAQSTNLLDEPFYSGLISYLPERY
jgi:hypothetical protein